MPGGDLATVLREIGLLSDKSPLKPAAISSAVPVCSTYTFGSQAAHWVAAGQCDCIYYHNTYLTDFPIVGALIENARVCEGSRSCSKRF